MYNYLYTYTPTGILLNPSSLVDQNTKVSVGIEAVSTQTDTAIVYRIYFACRITLALFILVTHAKAVLKIMADAVQLYIAYYIQQSLCAHVYGKILNESFGTDESASTNATENMRTNKFLLSNEIGCNKIRIKYSF